MNFSQMLPMVKAMGGGGGGKYSQVNYVIPEGTTAEGLLLLSNSCPDFKVGATGYIVLANNFIIDTYRLIVSEAEVLDGKTTIYCIGETSVSGVTSQEYIYVDGEVAAIEGVPSGFYLICGREVHFSADTEINFFWVNP